MSLEEKIRATLEAEAERLPPPSALGVAGALTPTRPRRAGPVFAVAAFLVVLISGFALSSLLRNGGLVEQVTTVTDSTENEATVTAPSVDRTLAPTAVGKELLWYPTVLPSDLKDCSEVINDPTFRLTCTADDPGVEREITLEIRPTGYPKLDGEAVPGHFGWSRAFQGTAEVIEVPVGVTWRLRAVAVGVDSDELVAVVDSIPVIGDRQALIPAFELPLVLVDTGDDALEALIARDREVEVVRDTTSSAFIVVGSSSEDRVLIHVGSAQPGDLVEFVGELGDARLVDQAERPMVIGTSNDQTQIVWIQRGLLWSLLTPMPEGQAVDFSLDLSQSISSLP